jgi:hypothetical protein
MNTIWFFGESYTKGSGCLEGDKYYDSSKKIFPSIICDTLNYKLVNKGIDGGCNEWILSSILKESINFKSNDIVVACNTISWGFIQYHVKRNKILSVNDPYTLSTNIDFFNSEEEMKVYSDYRNIRKKYEFKLDKFYHDQFDSISKFLSTNSVHMITWSFYEWFNNPDKYESITSATNGKIKDMHFSYKSHQNMANHILGLMYDKFSFLKKPLN